MSILRDVFWCVLPIARFILVYVRNTWRWLLYPIGLKMEAFYAEYIDANEVQTLLWLQARSLATELAGNGAMGLDQKILFRLSFIAFVPYHLERNRFPLVSSKPVASRLHIAAGFKELMDKYRGNEALVDELAAASLMRGSTNVILNFHSGRPLDSTVSVLYNNGTP